MQEHSFRAVIRESDGGGAYVEIPFDVERAFGAKRVKVAATIDGEPYRGSLVRMGGDCHMLIVLKGIRAKIGKGPGDEVAVVVREDTEPRRVEVPADLADALAAHAEARAFFDRLSYTNQREYVAWITSARRDETRRTRISRAVQMLAQGKREP
ncbi:MAG TPA: YdeI/OmpD-associated family protein [Longimicrobium sp.]|nr:YdeI/OmpD-associated family protein [Longimicrobium sp.]